MNKLLLFIILFVLSPKSTWAQAVTSIDVYEYDGSLKAAVSLQNRIDGTSLGGTASASGTKSGQAVTAGTGVTGLGLTLDFTITDAAVTAVVVNAAGSGYKVGDQVSVLKEDLGIANAAADPAKFTFTLTEDDFPKNEIIAAASLFNALDGTSLGGTASASGSKSAQAVTAGTGVTGSGLTLDFTITSGFVTAVVVNAAGSGYKVGDQVSVLKEDLGIANAAADPAKFTITLKASHFQGVTQVLKSSGGYRDSVGGAKAFADSTKAGYYAALTKSAIFIRVHAVYTSLALTPTLGLTTDTTLTTAILSSTFDVADGLNVLKLATSVTTKGPYEIFLIKPEDQIQVITSTTSKRSIEISYNPVAVGELTCSAFEGDNTDPTDLAGVKTSTNINRVDKSTRTHNILAANVFKSVQMTLNGLKPAQAYEIHCHHLAHGIISHTSAANGAAVTATTLDASLTGVTLLPDTLSAGAFSTLTLTFTHEVSLGNSDTIKLTLYSGNDNAPMLITTANTCGDGITTATSGGIAISGTETCAVSSSTLAISLAGDSTVSGTNSGTEVVFVLLNEDNGSIDLPLNPASGTVIRFDLEVTDHAKLEGQIGWVTTS